MRATGLNEEFFIIFKHCVALVKDTGPKNLVVRHTHTRKNYAVAKSVLIQQSAAPVDEIARNGKLLVRPSLRFPSYTPGARLRFTVECSKMCRGLLSCTCTVCSMCWCASCVVIAKGREGSNIQGRDRYRCTMWVQVGPRS